MKPAPRYPSVCSVSVPFGAPYQGFGIYNTE